MRAGATALPVVFSVTAGSSGWNGSLSYRAARLGFPRNPRDNVNASSGCVVYKSHRLLAGFPGMTMIGTGREIATPPTGGTAASAAARTILARFRGGIVNPLLRAT